jgi:hypothetical protein
MFDTSFFQTSTPFVVGSKWPYHQPKVGTSDAIVASGSVVGGEPSGLEGWWVGIGTCGVERDKLPGIKFDGYHFVSLYPEIMGPTLDGSNPTTVGVHPMPVPRAIFVKALTTLVFPEQGGPTTITLGPLSTPS